MCLYVLNPKTNSHLFSTTSPPYLDETEQFLKKRGLIRISNKNIKCYKIYRYANLWQDKSVLYSPYKDYQISKSGDIIQADNFGVFRVIVSSNQIRLQVHQGIHAYRKKSVATRSFSSSWVTRRQKVIRVCYIPAYTPYIIGTYGEIVALTMIITRDELTHHDL